MNVADEIYDALIRPIEKRMMSAVARLVREPDEAADVFQDALERIWRKLKRIHRHPNPHAYILRLCVSAAYDHLRRRSRRRRREAEWNEEALSIPATAAADDLVREEILAAIASLPRKQAEAVVLRGIEGESFEAIGRAFGCSEATARSHFSKGRARLRETLARADERANPAEEKDNERRTA